MPLDWDHLRCFVTVARVGSLTHAAQQMGLSQSAISRQIQSLESSLKVALFQRHARGLSLTEAGETLLRTAEDVSHQLNLVTARIRESTTSPSGELRVTTTMVLGTHWLTQLLPEFHKAYPDIHLTLLLDDREYDLATREADVAIRMLPPEQDSDLIFRNIMRMELGLFASRSYIAEHGQPASLADLINHQVLAFPEETPLPYRKVNWHLPGPEYQNEFTPLLKINSTQGLLLACRLGLGVASLPVFVTANDSELVRVLPQVNAPTVDVYLVYRREQKNSPKMVALRNFIRQRVIANSKQS